MDIQAVNRVLVRAIGGIQAGELEGLIAGEIGLDEASTYKPPSPKAFYKPPSPAAMKSKAAKAPKGKAKCKKDCFDRYREKDGSFKKKGGSSWNACVAAFKNCCDVDDPRRVCAGILGKSDKPHPRKKG